MIDILRKDNLPLLDVIAKEISSRQAWKSELNSVTSNNGKIIAIGNVCKKATYTAIGDDITLFCPSYNGYVCIDKVITTEQNSPDIVLSDNGIYGYIVIDGYKYIFSLIHSEDGTIDKKLASTNNFGGYCTEYITMDILKSKINLYNISKPSEVSKELQDYVSNFDKDSTEIRIYVKGLKDADYTEIEKSNFRLCIANKILDNAKLNGVIERKVSTMVNYVLAYVLEHY